MTTPAAPKKPKPARRPNARDVKPINNLPLRPRVGLHLRQPMRDLIVIEPMTRAGRVVCLTPDGAKLKRTEIKWAALRKSKDTRAL